MLANPVGPAVVGGTANFATAGNTLTVTNTPNAIINWQAFSIGAGEATRFVQRSASSSVLNRVVGQDPSAILGTLSSNGRVFLINPNGILFGAGSRVDVAGLVASTLNLSNQDFLAGRLNFEAGATANPVLNYGNIATPSGGRVYLIAPNVENHGVISTPQGQTILAAGKTVQLVEADVPNLRVEIQSGGQALNVGQMLADGGSAGIYAGLINQRGIVRADSATRDAAGNIVFRASGIVNLDSGSVTSASSGSIAINADVVIHTGTVDASGASGGSIAMQARNVLSAGRLSADGTAGQGGSVSVEASGRILQTAAAHVSADSVGGDGGAVTLQAKERFFGSGSLSATGSAKGGNIKVLAGEIVLLGAAIDASGNAGGGAILVGGDFQGRNPAVPNAAATSINFSTTLKADALVAGDGGKVIVWSDNETKFYGTVSARGGAQSGNGGFMEISGKENLTMGGFADAGAPHGTPGTLLLDPKNIVIDSSAGSGLAVFQLVDPNPGTGGDQFAQQVVGLANNNIVATDPNDDFVALNAGATYLFNGATGALISTLTGSTSGDFVGNGGVVALSSGNYVVRSPFWRNGGVVSAGAVTFGSGATGVTGVVSVANSLVGSIANDNVGGGSGGGVTALPNGNYLVISPNKFVGANSNAGAVTFGNGTTGVSGTVFAGNSLVGGSTNDFVGGGGITVLSNGNYVVTSANWKSGAALLAGAVTFGSSTTGISGFVSSTNSLVGSTASDRVGQDGITALTNGNYVVRSSVWNSGAGGAVGAVTWGNGAGGTVGAVSAGNSLVGSTTNDQVGSGGVTALTNGNYVVSSSIWHNGGAVNAGAVTWGSGTTGVTGIVSAANSLVGSTAFDTVGLGVTALPNGNYVVNNRDWNNGAAGRVGAVTWGNGLGGTVGPVSVANSLVGSTNTDQVGGSGVIVLPNGNYVVNSGNWDNGGGVDAGAVTFVDPTVTTPGAVGNKVGIVSASNSLVGSTANDFVGIGGVRTLANGNYVVASRSWNGLRGAVTWGSGTTGVTGVVSAANSLVGSTVGDSVSIGGVTALANGNYVVSSLDWNGLRGAVTWGNGLGGTVGAVSAANSLVGTTTNDAVGGGGVTALSNGNYVVRSPNWANPVGPVANVGAATFGNGTTGITGPISAANSLVGSTAGDQVSITNVEALANGNYVVRSPNWHNGGTTQAGAVTFGNGTTGISGTVSPLNSLVGSQSFDNVGEAFALIANSNYVAVSYSWNNGPISAAGAVTFGSGTTGVSGVVSAANSLVGGTAGDGNGGIGISSLPNGNFVAAITRADNGALVDAGLVYLVSPPTAVSFPNPLAFASSPSSTATISPAAITAITNTGTAVVLQANNDITLAAASNIVTSAAGAGGALTMQAGRSVLLNSNITTDNGSLTIKANEQLASGVIDAQRDPGVAVFTMAPGTTINAGSGAVTIALRDGAGLTNSQGGAITLGNVSGGNVLVQNNAAGGAGGINILGALTFGGNATIQAAGATSDVIVSNSIIGTGAAGNNLTVQAGNSILFNSGASVSTTNSLNVVLNSDRDANGAGNIQLAAGTSIASNGGNIVMGGGASPLTGYAQGSGSGQASASGIYIAGDINAGAGNVTLHGKGAAGFVQGDGVALVGGTLSSNGAVTIDGIAQAWHAVPACAGVCDFVAGVHFANPGVRLTTATGTVNVTGTNSTANVRAQGVTVDGATIETTGTGTLTLNGTSNPLPDTNWGVGVLFGGTVRTTAAGGGAVSLIGSASPADGGVVLLDGNVTSGGGEIRMLSQAGSLALAGNSQVGGAGSGNILMKVSDGSPIDVTGAVIDAGTSALTLSLAGGSVNGNNNSITAGALRLLGSGSFNLGGTANIVGTLAANVTGPVTYRNSGNLSVGTVASFDGSASTSTVGITATGNVDLNASGTLTVSNAVTAGGSFGLRADGNLLINANLTANTTGAGLRSILIADANNDGLGSITQSAGSVITTNNGGLDIGIENIFSSESGAFGSGQNIVFGGTVNAGSGRVSVHNESGFISTSGTGLIAAADLALRSQQGIDIDTSVNRIAIRNGGNRLSKPAGTGDVIIRNDNNGGTLTLQRFFFSGSLSVQNRGGNVSVSNNGTISVTDPVDGTGIALTASGGGDIALGGNLSAGAGTANLTAAGSITQTAGNVTAGGTANITAGGAIVLTSTGNDFQGLVTLGNSGANAVSIADANTISFASMTLGGNFTVTAPSIILSNVTNTGVQQYNGAALINGAYVTNGSAFNVTGTTTVGGASTINAGAGAITLTGAVDSAAATNNSLALFSSSVETFGGTIGAAQALSSISTDAPGTVSLGGNVTTTGAQSFNDAVTGGAVALTSTGGGAIFVNNAGFNVPSGISTTGAVTLAGPLVGTSGTPLVLLVTPAGLAFTQVATAFLTAPSIPAAIAAPAGSSITINGGLFAASTVSIAASGTPAACTGLLDSTGVCNAAPQIPPPPPQVLPPAPPQPLAPPQAEEQTSGSGTIPLDDAAWRRRVPRCG